MIKVSFIRLKGFLGILNSQDFWSDLQVNKRGLQKPVKAIRQFGSQDEYTIMVRCQEDEGRVPKAWADHFVFNKNTLCIHQRYAFQTSKKKIFKDPDVEILIDLPLGRLVLLYFFKYKYFKSLYYWMKKVYYWMKKVYKSAILEETLKYLLSFQWKTMIQNHYDKGGTESVGIYVITTWLTKVENTHSF